jgi:DNA-binding SARP family transcriptional activator
VPEMYVIGRTAMSGVASSGTAATVSGVISILVFLGCIATSVVILVSRLRARSRRRKEPPAPTPEQRWAWLLAPITAPGWAAPKRPAPIRTNARATPVADPAAAASPASDIPNGAFVVDLRTEGADPLVRETAEAAPTTVPVEAPATAPAAAQVGESDAFPVGTLAPPRALLTEPFVTVLGEPDVVGWVHKPDRRVVTEMAVYLGMHRVRPARAEALLEVLWPPSEDGTGPSPDVNYVHQTASRLRRCLGTDAVPDAVATGGYLLAEWVTCDWDRFRQLDEAGNSAEDPKPYWAEALGLVNGPPFAGLPKDSYRWVWSELLASKLTAAIVDLAHRLSTRALADGDVAMAESAARKGLDASPAEELLMEDRLEAAFALRDFARLERTWEESRRTLGSQAESGPVGATYRALRSQLRGPD